MNVLLMFLCMAGAVELDSLDLLMPSGCIVKGDNSVEYPDGSVREVDGSVSLADGRVLSASEVSAIAESRGAAGDSVLPDGSVLLANGCFEYPSGTVSTAEGKLQSSSSVGSGSVSESPWVLPVPQPAATKESAPASGSSSSDGDSIGLAAELARVREELKLAQEALESRGEATPGQKSTTSNAVSPSGGENVGAAHSAMTELVQSELGHISDAESRDQELAQSLEHGLQLQAQLEEMAEELARARAAVQSSGEEAGSSSSPPADEAGAIVAASEGVPHVAATAVSAVASDGDSAGLAVELAQVREELKEAKDALEKALKAQADGTPSEAVGSSNSLAAEEDEVVVAASAPSLSSQAPVAPVAPAASEEAQSAPLQQGEMVLEDADSVSTAGTANGVHAGCGSTTEALKKDKDMLANKLGYAEQQLEEANAALEAQALELAAVQAAQAQQSEGEDQLESLLGASFAALSAGGLDYPNLADLAGAGLVGAGGSPEKGKGGNVNQAMANELADAKRQVEALHVALDRAAAARDSKLRARIEELEGRTEELEASLSEKEEQLAAMSPKGVVVQEASSLEGSAARVGPSDYFHQVTFCLFVVSLFCFSKIGFPLPACRTCSGFVYLRPAGNSGRRAAWL